MPRVYRKTARASKSTRTCRGCGAPIEAGQEFYLWAKRFGGKQYCHVACGPVKQSWLSNRKTAVIYDMISDANIGSWDPGTLSDFIAVPYGSPVEETGDTIEVETDSLTTELESIADEAESVGDEYESSADNMPESLQYGYQAEAMRDVAERLRDWAQELRDASFENQLDLPEAPEADEGEEPDWNAWWEEAEQAFQDKVGELISTAEDLLGEVPEYEG